MKTIFLFMSVLVLISSGCTFYAVDANEILKASNKEVAKKDIRYIENVSVPYEVIGHVTVNTERRNSMDEVIDKMKRQVAMLGGDAITNIIQTDKPSPITHVRTVYTGTVIIFTDTPQEESSVNNAEPVTENFK